MKTIVRVKFGSHLYGTSTPTSDLDYKAVHIPNWEDIVLQKVKLAEGNERQKAEGEKNNPGDVDEQSYALHRFLQLAAEGQTVALEMLFAPIQNIEISTGWWRYLVQNRHRLLTRKSLAFVGYCRQQANKYGIKGSRVAAALAAFDAFTLMAEKHGSTAKLNEFLTLLVALKNANPDHMAIVEQDNARTGTTEVFFECCNRKVPLTATVKLASEVFGRIYENYGDRARKAQANEGVDWKALSHAVRVGTQALELLSTGNITLPLVNAHHLLEIKQGKLPYEAVSDEIEKLLVAVEEGAGYSALPDEPDHEFIRRTVINAYGNTIVSNLHTFQEAN